MARWDEAEVSERKILGYLLAVDHPTGGDKAIFFMACGFTRLHWSRFRDALIAAAEGGTVVAETRTPFGIKSVVDGMILTPVGRSIALRMVWIRDELNETPRLVTAYPKKGGADDVQGA